MSIKSEILDIARDHGYTGSASTITGAINALTDTLAGEDVQGGRTVASAISKLAPYVGAGGGGGGIGVGFWIQAKQSYMTINDRGVNATIDGMLVVGTTPTTTQGSMPVVPSGLDYTVELDVSTTVTSVTLNKHDNQMRVVDSQSIEFTTGTPKYGSGVTVMFSVPPLSFEGGYGDYGQPLYGVVIQA